MTRAINKTVTKPVTEAIVRNAVKQSSAVAEAAQRALSGVVSPVPAPQSRGSGRWEDGTAGLGPLAQRHYRIFIPAGVTARRRAPMLVLLHGCGQDAASLPWSRARQRRRVKRNAWCCCPSSRRRPMHSAAGTGFVPARVVAPKPRC